MQRVSRSTYTTLEAAAITGFHPQTIRAAIKDDELPAAGNRPYRISAVELLQWWKGKGGGEIVLPQQNEDLRDVRNPVGLESTVDHGRKVAGALRTLANLGEKHGLDFPDLKDVADEIEAALPEPAKS